jgi:cell division initiation protein
MKLTPLDIRHKEFKRGMRGYADVEVDEFLDEVADEYERLFKENIDLTDRVEALEEKVAGYQRIEDTLQKTLVNAQASAEEQKQNANKQAQLVLQDAELKARQMVNEAYTERQGIEQAMAKLRAGEEDFRFKFRQMLEGYLMQIREAPEIAEEAPAPSDFSRHAEAIKEAIARESVPDAPSPVSRAATPAPKGPTPAHADPQPARDVPEPPAAAPRRMPEAPAVETTRGPQGVQAGAPRREPAPPAPPRDDPPPAESDTTMSQPAKAPGAEPATAASEAGEPPHPPRERIQFGESDDLLSDVDSGVNENEFKW